MNRKEFFKNGLVGLGSMVVMPTVLKSCKKDEIDTENGNCTAAPNETAGPFPIKSPADLVKANIVSDRAGIALLINLTIQDASNNCLPVHGAIVDIWHCDASGAYSQYGGNGMQATDYKNVNFLRGRQSTDANGMVSFISIFPGWYSGRAPHIHLEVFDINGKSIKTTQIAFPEDITNTVYSSTGYKGKADTKNSSDNIFSDSLSGNMADSVSGSNADGYTLHKVIVV